MWWMPLAALMESFLFPFCDSVLEVVGDDECEGWCSRGVSRGCSTVYGIADDSVTLLIT